jgi:hypothetical protein
VPGERRVDGGVGISYFIGASFHLIFPVDGGKAFFLIRHGFQSKKGRWRRGRAKKKRIERGPGEMDQTSLKQIGKIEREI